jgi:adenylate cyclase
MSGFGSRMLWIQYGRAVLFALLLGLFVGSITGALLIRPPLTGALLGMASSVIDFALIMGLIGGVEIFLPRTPAGRWLAARPFLLTVLFKAVIYLAVLGAVLGGRVGPRLLSALIAPETARLFARQGEAGFPRGLLITLGAVITFLMVMLRNAAQLVGDRSFRDIVFGRYHRPRAEERFFLFVDVVGSTPVAERLGPQAVHRYLDRIFRLASDPVDDHRGEVYQYVGDEMVVTWTLADGRPEARPLACLFAIEAALAAAAPEFEREFGAAPKLRAALHAGEVMTGEIGGTRRALVFHGDTMNTTSRIENLTRALGRNFLVSEDALRRMQGADAYAPEDLGPQELRGKEARMRVYAVGAPGAPGGRA